MTKPKILLLTLEFPHWQDAAKFSYEANFGLEEGLKAKGVELTTVPVLFNAGNFSGLRWLELVRAQLRGKRYDQVWFEIAHSTYPAEFREFIVALAPVRVGFQFESTEFHPLENPTATQSRIAKFTANHETATHLVMVDEADCARFNGEGTRPAFWWAGGHIPKRLMATAPLPATKAPAEFHGTLYGERAKWFAYPELSGLLAQGSSLEGTTPYPAQWDRLSQKLAVGLEENEPISGEMFFSYIDFIRTARRETYPLWLKSLAHGTAVVNLPQFGKAYASRVTQGLAAGRPVVTWDIVDRPRTRALFESGKELLLYSQDNPAELAEHIRRLQTDRGFGQMLARNGLAKMKRFHTTEKFVCNILSWLETGAEPDYSDNTGARASPAPAWIARLAIPAVAAVIADPGVPAKDTDLTKLQARGLAREGQPLRLHLGCGEQYIDGYVNIDYPNEQHNVMQVRADYLANITELDFPLQSVDEIRLHHVFEHFNRVTALAMLIKWQQWLKVGGKLHIETPDLMGSAEILTSDLPWPVKMGTVRHLAGDQAASWAYHVDHWFPERYQHTLKRLGFGRVDTQTSRWPHSPHLCNVQAIGIKTEILSLDPLLVAADELLWESTVAPAEKPTHAVWTRQLRAVLNKTHCGPGNIHTADIKAVAPAGTTVRDDPPAKVGPPPASPVAAAGVLPLDEIHDFNQRSRDRWVQGKAATVPAGARVLDMGAGTCLYRPLFAHCDYKTHDFKQYEGAEKHGGTSAYGKIDYVSEILAIPAPDQSFDVILCTEVLEHVPEPIKVLKEISRLLRPGGRAFITAPLGSGLHQLPFHFYGGYTPEWYKRFSQEAGMEVNEITPNGGFFKHLAQECARAASIYAQNPKLHGQEAGEIHKLLVENLPRLFFALDDQCFDERFTVGYFVETVKTPEKYGPKKSSAAQTVARAETRSAPAMLPATAPVLPVVVTLMGGLGNQMFQYAAGLALAKKRQVPLQLDLTFLRDKSPRTNFTPRDYSLDAFPLHAGCTLITAVEAMPTGLTTVTEKSFAYDPVAADAPAGSRLHGYWQCARYSEKIATEVRKAFESAPKLSKATETLAAQIQSRTAVCIHVRRGDMVHNAHTASIHGSCPIEYYQSASDVMAQKYPDAHFYIFSDDADWCAKNDLTRGRPCTVARPDDQPGNAVVDLFLMRHCRHFIIANSTFSWWAAYLGDFSGKTVIAPEPWFNSTAIDTSDLLPKDWIRLCRNPGPIVADQSAAPLVSVIMPCYKQANYLHEAIASVVAQTYPDWELIVVNDGSPDETSRVTREIIALHPERRIRLLEKVNGGLADARNAGIKEARGKYILPLDSDDKIHPEMLKKTVALLNANPGVAIAYTDLARFGSLNDFVALPEYSLEGLVRQNQLNCCSLFRREAWGAAGGYNMNMRLGYEDWDFWIGCGEKGFIGKRIPEALFFYRVKNSSMFTNALQHHNALHAQIIANHPRLFSEEAKRAAAKILASAPTIEKANVKEKYDTPLDSLKGKRILVYTDDPGQGGAAHYNNLILLALMEAGAQASCAQPLGDGSLASAQAKAGVKHCWTGFNPVVDFGRSFVDEADARRVFSQTQPDLVYFSDCCAFSHIAAKRAAISLKIPFVVICHSEATYLAERFAQYLPVVKEQLTSARAVIAVSQNSRSVMQKYFGLAADKGQVIHNGCAESYFEPVDLAIRSKLRAELNIPADAVLCFTAARLDAGKCHQLQLEAIRRLRESGGLGALYFAWAGDGDLRPQLEEKVKAYKLEDRIHLLGYRWDVKDLMGAADVFVLTTLYEAMPLCILEAMARGLPVVASSVGGIPEELGESGILLPDPNHDPQKTIATLMESLEVLASSPQRRQSLSAVSKARAQEFFSASRMTGTTLDLLRQSLADKIPTEASEEIFETDEVQVYEQLASTYSSNPTEAGVLGQLKQLQQGLMNFLVTAQSDKLEAQFNGTFGQVYRSLIKCGLSTEVPTEETTAQLAALDEALGGPEDPKKNFDYRPMLARMLLAPAHHGMACLVPEKIPPWLLDEYLAYNFRAPQVFVAKGEAELYHAHLLSWAQAVHQRTRITPGASMTRRLATVFAEKTNCIPIYLSQENTREFSQLRAAIIKYILLQNGATIDVKLPKRPKGRRKIKVGFLNAHFGPQTETHVTLPSLQLDRSKFEICLFPVATNPSPIEEYCRSFADSFALLPKELARQVKMIREAALDVVIIGTNVTAVTNQVSLIAQHRLAPLQLTSYCSPVSTGMQHIDGFLTGTLNDFPGLQEHFTEKLYFCDGPPGCLDYTVESPGSGKSLDRASLGLTDDDLIFVNAAACFKILPEMQDTWAKILAAVPKSRLILLPFNPNWSNEFPLKQFERTLSEACARHGVGRERFILVGSLPSRADVKALERVADVYLDTSPFSGSISVIDPLELGLPLVVQEGATHRSRMASALLREIGLPELITTHETAYISLAVRLGSDGAYRSQLKERILAAMAKRPKFINAKGYAQGLGKLLESLVQVK